MHVNAGIDKIIKKTAGQTHSTSTIRAIWVATAPTSDDTDITFLNSGGTATEDMEAALFVVGQQYAVDASSVTVGTGGVFYLWIA